MHHVAVLALDGVVPFELGIPSRIFNAARSPAGDPLYEVVVCGIDSQSVRTADGYAIVVDHDAADVLAKADTVVVPPVYRHPDTGADTGADTDGDRRGGDGDGGGTALDPCPVFDADRLTQTAERVRAAFAHLRPGTRVISICTASFLLAATGLLDGRRATTHWREADRFRHMFPRVDIDPDVLFVDDGDVLTSAGVASGIDLCLHVVRRDHGSEVANRAARSCVVPPWREGGQAQYVERPVPPSTGASTAATRAWLLERLHEPMTLAELAAHAQMSVRTFTRRFRDEAGMTPGRWLTAQRVERARQLLESSDLPVDLVARHAGFATDISLRRHFRAAVGVSPIGYRRTFRDRHD